MRFGSFGLADALGLRLAHTLRIPGRVLRKGRILDPTDLAALAAAGLSEVSGARLDANELDEDAAAAAAALIVAGSGVAAKKPGSGRCNIAAATAGLVLVEAPTIDRLNGIDEALTVATLAPYSPARAGQVVATVKTIPFAVADTTLAAWRTAAPGPAVRVIPFVRRRVALVSTTVDSLTEKLIAATEGVTRHRIESLGSELALELRCPHRSADIRAAIASAIAAGCRLVLIAGASVSKDRGDTIPAAITAAGGEIIHFGMPVEPGNMLLYGCIGRDRDAIPILNLPGCARSRRANGLDRVLQRLLAGLPVGSADIMAMGVGGLIRSDVDAGDPVAEAAATAAYAARQRQPRIAALILAAGRSQRMGERNKLLCEVNGRPMIAHAVDSALASQCRQVMLVTGHDRERIEAVVDDRPLSRVHNADHASGMASSLRCGLRALPTEIDAVVIVLADMPRVTAAHIDRLIAAFDPAHPAIVVPERRGRRGNPILWPRQHFAEMMRLEGDQGARRLLDHHADNLLRVAMDDDAVLIDADTPEALAVLADRSDDPEPGA